MNISDVTTNPVVAAQFGKVAVLFGGHSAERPVSLNSGNAVLAALLRSGVNAEGFDPATRHIAEITQYDRAFIVLHGRGGEDGQMQGLLESMNVPYTGSGVLASALGMDKARTKQLWQGCQLPTAPYRLLDAAMDVDALVAELGLPLIIKPVHEGSSIGMCKVSTAAELLPAFQQASQHDASVMAEAWITGKEFTIVILAGKALPVIRLQPPADVAFYDFDAKYLRNDTTYGIPCGLSAADEAALQSLALTAFNAVGATGWGRIDAMQDEQGRFWLLEINTVPGMTDHSLVPMAAQAAGVAFDQLCLNILAQTLAPAVAD